MSDLLYDTVQEKIIEQQKEDEIPQTVEEEDPPLVRFVESTKCQRIKTMSTSIFKISWTIRSLIWTLITTTTRSLSLIELSELKDSQCFVYGIHTVVVNSEK